MALTSIFGTDGVRGIANSELTPELALKLALAGGRYLLQQKKGGERSGVLIGRDSRLSGDMLQAALIAGFTSAGLDVYTAGILPTPGVAYLTRNQNFCGGVMISASHNPIEDNGIKFFNSDGTKLSDEQEKQIEEYIEVRNDFDPPLGTEVGQLYCALHLQNQYRRFLLQKAGRSFQGYRVVLDTAYGAAWELGPRVWEDLGAEVIALHDSPAGEKINYGCGSTSPDRIKEVVQETKADFGFAFDGDADRVIALDENGRELDGDYIMAICGSFLLEKKQLPGNTVAATQYSNQGLKEALQQKGGDLLLTRNGDRYVLQAMRGQGLILGGEKSGHIIFLEDNATGDGILTSIKLAEVVRVRGEKLSCLAEIFQPWPQRLENVRVRDKNWKQNNRIQEVIKNAEETFGDRGRILVRASGTEPVIRVMVEGKDEKVLDLVLGKVVEVIARELG